MNGSNLLERVKTPCRIAWDRARGNVGAAPWGHPLTAAYDRLGQRMEILQGALSRLELETMYERVELAATILTLDPDRCDPLFEELVPPGKIALALANREDPQASRIVQAIRDIDAAAFRREKEFRFRAARFAVNAEKLEAAEIQRFAHMEYKEGLVAGHVPVDEHFGFNFLTVDYFGGEIDVAQFRLTEWVAPGHASRLEAVILIHPRKLSSVERVAQLKFPSDRRESEVFFAGKFRFLGDVGHDLEKGVREGAHVVGEGVGAGVGAVEKGGKNIVELGEVAIEGVAEAGELVAVAGKGLAEQGINIAGELANQAEQDLVKDICPAVDHLKGVGDVKDLVQGLEGMVEAAAVRGGHAREAVEPKLSQGSRSMLRSLDGQARLRELLGLRKALMLLEAR